MQIKGSGQSGPSWSTENSNRKFCEQKDLVPISKPANWNTQREVEIVNLQAWTGRNITTLEYTHCKSTAWAARTKRQITKNGQAYPGQKLSFRSSGVSLWRRLSITFSMMIRMVGILCFIALPWTTNSILTVYWLRVLDFQVIPELWTNIDR